MSQPVSLERQRAFLSAPDPNRYFPAGAAEEARLRIVRCIQRDEGPALLVGATGCGKSLMLHVIAQQFREERRVAMLMGAQLCTRRALLQMILFELGLPYRGMDEGELRLSILRFLRSEEGVVQPALVLIDEADALPSRLLEELRALTNVTADGHILVQMVLAGGARLEEKFADPQHDVFSQRIAARCYLEPLSHAETCQYVRAQAAAVGINPDLLFAPDCLDAIHQATDGIPRLINQLGDQLVWGATASQRPTVLDAVAVQEAWSELQQLPAPWNTDPAAAGGFGDPAGVVEFADLTDRVAATAHPPAPLPVVAAQLSREIDEVDDVEEINSEPNDELDGGDDQPLEVWESEEPPASIPFHAFHAAAPPGPLPVDDRIEIDLDVIGDPRSVCCSITATDPDAADDLAPIARDDGADDAIDFAVNDTTDRAVEPAAVEPAVEPTVEPFDDPFDEPFDEEEVLIDPYLGCEARIFAAVPAVVNRLDRGFAEELRPGRSPSTDCRPTPNEELPELEPLSLSDLDSMDHLDTELDEEEEGDGQPATRPEVAAKTATFQPVRVDPPSHPSPHGNILVVEDEEANPRLVPSRQFRRLFSALESGKPLASLR